MGSVSARQVLDEACSEQEYQSLILEYAHRLGYRSHHQLVPFRRGRDGKPRAIVEPFTDKGFPDIVLVRGGVTLYLEVKTERGRLSADQQAWGDALLMAGCDWRVVRPSDWCEVEALLKGE
jgi:hypothetical protein